MLLERPGDEYMWLAWVTKVPNQTQRYMHTCIFDMPILRSVVLAAEQLTLSSFEHSAPRGVAGEL